MSIRTRFALAFALVGAVVAGLVGVLSYQTASDRITAEIDRSLRSVTAAVEGGQDQVLASGTAIEGGGGRGPGRDGDRDGGLVAQSVAPDGTPTYVGGRPVVLPVPAATRLLAASGAPGQTATSQVVVSRDTDRQLTTALGGGRGALQVAVDVDQTRRVLGGMANQITWVSLAVLLAAAGAGWLLALRITRRLVRLTGIAEEVSVHGRVDQERLVQDAAHELRTPLTSLRTNASVLRRIGELSPDARDRLVRARTALWGPAGLNAAPTRRESRIAALLTVLAMVWMTAWAFVGAAVVG
jgi:two-component system, OmpR family, sensor histidine kinase MprB